jgi:hypothetical protein
MELDAEDVLTHLKESGIERLYHANTTRTACTFLKQGELLSRGVVEDRNLDQTYQYTDQKDKKLGVWYSLFFDTVDLSDHLNRRNKYGPILFEFDVDLLSSDRISKVWITRENPSNWSKGSTLEERYLQEGDLESYSPTSTTCFKHSVVLRGAGGLVPLEPYLQTIRIDNPKKGWFGSDDDQFSVFWGAFAALYNSARSGGVLSSLNFRMRSCSDRYIGVSKDEVKKLFGP